HPRTAHALLHLRPRRRGAPGGRVHQRPTRRGARGRLMRSRFVPIILSNADVLLKKLAPAVGRGTPRPTAERLCRAYRVRGCAASFMSCQPVHLLGDLQRSGAAHAAWLEQAKDAEKVTGRAAPFFDALASGDLDTARRIAQRSSHRLNPDYELPEDFA